MMVGLLGVVSFLPHAGLNFVLFSVEKCEQVLSWCVFCDDDM